MTTVSGERVRWNDSEEEQARRSPAKSVIEVEAVTRSFGSVTVIDDVSFTVEEGEILALIGPSGSGKSTLVEMIVGLQVPTSGSITVFGKEPRTFGAKEKKELGYVPQHFLMYPGLTVHQNLKFVASLYGIGWLDRGGRIRRLLNTFDLWDARNRLAENISGGMQRRLAMVAGLLHDPKLLVVDEPTAGLDPALRAQIWAFLQEKAEEGTTMVVTTQNLDEAERCDRVGILSDARLITVGSPAELRTAAIGGDVVFVETERYSDRAVEALLRMDGVQRVEPEGWYNLRIVVNDAHLATPRVIEVLEEAGVDVRAARTLETSFDDVFLTYIERGKGNDASAYPNV